MIPSRGDKAAGLAQVRALIARALILLNCRIVAMVFTSLNLTLAPHALTMNT